MMNNLLSYMTGLYDRILRCNLLVGSMSKKWMINIQNGTCTYVYAQSIYDTCRQRAGN